MVFILIYYFFRYVIHNFVPCLCNSYTYHIKFVSLYFLVFIDIMNRLFLDTFSNWLFLVYKRWRRQWHPTPVLLPGKSHGRRALVGCSPWGRKESDMTEQLYFHFSLLCIGEGNGNPLCCSCLESPRDGVSWSRT